MDATKANDNAENSQNLIYYHECSFYYFKNYGSPTTFNGPDSKFILVDSK